MYSERLIQLTAICFVLPLIPLWAEPIEAAAFDAAGAEPPMVAASESAESERVEPIESAESTRVVSIDAAEFTGVVSLDAADTHPHHDPPKLVVGIMVDQMRPDYIYRYWEKFGDNGFRRLINDGFTFRNAFLDYYTASTAPGFASVYTGTTPSVHGIIANRWYSHEHGRWVSAVESPPRAASDPGSGGTAAAGRAGSGSAGPVTTDESDPGSDGTDIAVDGGSANDAHQADTRGPGQLLTGTLGDALRLHTNMQSRVVAISLKDRSAILPGGHLGEAYWFDGASGDFVTSSFYRDGVPEWLQRFNDRNLAEAYLSQPWETLLPIDTYTESIEDANSYERVHPEQETSSFPHDLPARVSEFNYDAGLVAGTPFGDKLLTDLAIAALEGEGLGRDRYPDLLAIGYSASDAIGHTYGPASVEVQDYYLRLDRYIGELLDELDRQVGLEDVLVFLTADHAGVHVPAYLKDLGMPAGYLDTGLVMEQLRQHLIETFEADLYLDFGDRHIWLNRDEIDRLDLAPLEVQREVVRFMLTFDEVGGAIPGQALMEGDFVSEPYVAAKRGHHQKRGGDVMIWKSPHHTFSRSSGTSHGTPWAYDRHVPMLWYGWNIPAGQSSYPVYASGIASTVSIFLNSPFPGSSTGTPMNDFFGLP